MSRTLIIGDVHLGKGTSIGKPSSAGALNSRIVDQKNLLNWILDVAQEKHVDRLILTGDVFEDVKPDYILLQIFIEWLISVQLSNIDTHIIVGNHDIKRTGNFYNSVLDVVSALDLERVFIYKNISTIEVPGVGFTFLPYRDRRSFGTISNAEALKIIENKINFEACSISSLSKKVLIGHLTLEGAIYIDEIDDHLNELMCPLSMFKDYDFTWMGHVHKPQVKSRNPYIAHIGSLDISDFGETTHQKILVLFDPTLEKAFEEIPVPSRPLRRFKISVPENQDPNKFIIDELENHHMNNSYNNAIVKVEITLNCDNSVNIDRKQIEDKIYKFGAFHICNFIESRNLSVISVEKKDLVDNSVDAKSAVKLYSNLLDFEDESYQNEFITSCINIIEEVSGKGD